MKSMRKRSEAYVSHRRKPEWLRIPIRGGENLKEVKELLARLHLHTVCQEANCPNRMECFSSRTATFMILGSVCSRNCRFCNVRGGELEPVDPEEPQRLAEAARRLGLEHVVVTSVTRDDLPDGGAGHFAEVIRALRSGGPGDGGVEGGGAQGLVDEGVGPAGTSGAAGLLGPAVEVLIPDFLGDPDALRVVIEARPEIINHNVETVPRLYRDVRPEADYGRSLELLRRVKERDPQIFTKSGLMVGLGESPEEVEAVMDDLRRVGCDFLTIGQYLAPSKDHFPVQEYVHPDRFEEYGKTAYRKGFAFAAAAPFVRSSYKAAEALR
mgnify:CR=1 FL=1